MGGGGGWKGVGRGGGGGHGPGSISLARARASCFHPHFTLVIAGGPGAAAAARGACGADGPARVLPQEPQGPPPVAREITIITITITIIINPHIYHYYQSPCYYHLSPCITPPPPRPSPPSFIEWLYRLADTTHSDSISIDELVPPPQPRPASASPRRPPLSTAWMSAAARRAEAEAFLLRHVRAVTSPSTSCPPPPPPAQHP